MTVVPRLLIRNPALPVHRSVVSREAVNASLPKGRVAGGRAWYIFFSAFGAAGDCACTQIATTQMATRAVHNRPVTIPRGSCEDHRFAMVSLQHRDVRVA